MVGIVSARVVNVKAESLQQLAEKSPFPIWWPFHCQPL